MIVKSINVTIYALFVRKLIIPQIQSAYLMLQNHTTTFKSPRISPPSLKCVSVKVCYKKISVIKSFFHAIHNSQKKSVLLNLCVFFCYETSIHCPILWQICICKFFSSSFHLRYFLRLSSHLGCNFSAKQTFPGCINN